VQFGQLIEADLLDPTSLDSVFALGHFDAVIPFCARSLVGESVQRPYDYYDNNVVGTLNLLRAMQRHAFGKIVFSSTAAVLGERLSARRVASQGANQLLWRQQAAGKMRAG